MHATGLLAQGSLAHVRALLAFAAGGRPRHGGNWISLVVIIAVVAALVWMQRWRNRLTGGRTRRRWFWF